MCACALEVASLLLRIKTLYISVSPNPCCAAVVGVNVEGENIDSEAGCSTLRELKVLLTGLKKNKNLLLEMQPRAKNTTCKNFFFGSGNLKLRRLFFFFFFLGLRDQ